MDLTGKLSPPRTSSAPINIQHINLEDCVYVHDHTAATGYRMLHDTMVHHKAQVCTVKAKVENKNNRAMWPSCG